jgi:hypothetical protein
MTKLFAFWPYDMFPRCCGGAVEKLADDRVVLKGWGSFKRQESMVFAPLNVGAKLHADIERLKQDHHAAIDAVNDKYNKLVAEAFQKANVQQPKRRPLANRRNESHE